MQVSGPRWYEPEIIHGTSMRSLKVNNVVDLEPTLLLVDDEVFNLEILEEYLQDHGYLTDSATNGREACELMQANPGKYQVVLLDRMMPEMGGMEVIQFMKQDPRLRDIPVIMQTAKATRQDIEEGLQAGILYYLTKPFAKEELFSIADTAARYFYECQDLHARVRATIDDGRLELAAPGALEFQTVEQARQAAVNLATLAADPYRTVVGLQELFVNAVEHGNLGIGFELKSTLQRNGTWQAEIGQRLQLPENHAKKARVDYYVQDGAIRYRVSDHGQGFNYREFLEINTARNLNVYGRGLAIARVLSFDKLVYTDPGNIVMVETQVNPQLGSTPLAREGSGTGGL